jgi:N6-adenosine-specific RNA methylase IME4
MWVYGEGRKYGEGVQLSLQLSKGPQYLQDLGVVCRAYEITRRHVVSFGHHAAAMTLKTNAERDAWLEKAATNGWSIKELRAELLIHKRRSRHTALTQRPPTSGFNGQRFSLIYADPPWKFKTHSILGQEMSSADNHYDTMELKDISGLLVDGRMIEHLAEKDAGCFLWTTVPYARHAFEVLDAWGFQYSSQAVWDKQRPAMGYIFRNQHEILIYATRGNMPRPLFTPPSVFSYPRKEHSAKPPEVRKAIEQMFPMFGEQDRIELFARGEVPGWRVWGDEAIERLVRGDNIVPVDAKTEENVKRLFLDQAEEDSTRCGESFQRKGATR